MVTDKLYNLERYASLNPHFPEVVEFLQAHPLETLPLGKTVISEHAFVNVVDSPAKAREAAKIETHNRMIDIQIAMSDSEEHGFMSRADLPEAAYNEEKDITFYEGLAHNYFILKAGEFVIYFPQDAHAPAITPTGLRKAIVKVAVL